jgi:RND family efflux transporter MFP subunit
LRKQEEELKKYTVTSSIDGIVMESYFDEGESVNIGDSLFKIASDHKKYAVVDVDEKYLNSLSVGKAVTVSSPLPASQSDKGIISEISPEVDYETGTIQIKVEILDNKEQYVKNMTVKILITTAAVENALVIPQRYLQSDDGLFVMGIDSSNRTVKKPVSVYNTNVERVYITEGLSIGDLILDPAGLKEGITVSVALEGDDSL